VYSTPLQMTSCRRAQPIRLFHGPDSTVKCVGSRVRPGTMVLPGRTAERSASPTTFLVRFPVRSRSQQILASGKVGHDDDRSPLADQDEWTTITTLLGARDLGSLRSRSRVTGDRLSCSRSWLIGRIRRVMRCHSDRRSALAGVNRLMER
jgi:hypothetical protein